MIFSIADHIEQIKARTKTQTRRNWDGYQVGKTYSIQPGRGKPSIPDGRIQITAKLKEHRHEPWKITEYAARQEGGYTPLTFEELYMKMYPNWDTRYAHIFKFIPSEGP